MDQLKTLLDKKQSLFDRRLGAFTVKVEYREQLSKNVEEFSETIQDLEAISAVFSTISEELEKSYIIAVEELVTEGLYAVFESDMQFKIQRSIKGRNVTYDFMMETEGELTPLVDSRGGGVLAVVGVILRMVIVRLMKEKVAQILVLDEPFSHLSSAYVPAAAQLLKSLGTDLGIQVLLVTHQQEFAEFADEVVTIE